MSYLQRTLAARHGLPADWLVIEWAASSSDPVDAGMSLAVVSYTIGAGRADLDANVDATTAQIVLKLATAPRVPDVAEPVQLRLGAQLAAALALPEGARARFTGEVVTRQLSGPLLTVTCVGRRSRLGSLVIGDTPWPAELDGARAARILALCAAQLPALELGPADAGTVTVLPRDVDRQPALALVEKLSESSTGQLVERRTGALEWHDAEHRRNLVPTVELTAANLLAGLAWDSGRDGLVNDLTAAYGTAPEGADRPTVRAVDQLGIDAMGPLAGSIDTELADATEAQAHVNLTVARRSSPWWAVPALTVDLARSIGPDQLAGVLAAEHGRAIRVTGLPQLHPMQTSRLMVEGYSETITPTGWQLTLSVADVAMAAPPPRWVDVLPGVTWADVDPALTWADAARWAAEDPTALGRWVDQPADLAWHETAPTWADY